MKVGLFLKNFRPEIGGGANFEAEVFRSLIEYGADSGHTFTVFSWVKEVEKAISGKHIEFVPLQQSYSDRTLPQRIKYKFTKTTSDIYKKLNLNPLFKPENLVEKLIIKHGVEVIWYLELGTYDYLTMDIPFITTVWDLEHRHQPYFPEVSTRGRWDRREKSYGIKIQRAAAIVTGTAAGKAEIKRFYGVSPERIKIIPYPIPAFAFNPSFTDRNTILAKYNIPEEYLFYPAQFWPHKNHANLLIALKLLRDEHNLVMPIVFVGADKGNQQYIKKLVADLNLSSQVYFLGFVPQTDLHALYQNAFALTFASLCGPDNLPPIEAFALGCPVIAAKVAGAEEQMGDAALLVDGTDEKQIAWAIKSLHDSTELRSTLIQRGWERASKLTGENYIKKIFSILDDLTRIRRCWSREEPFRQK